MTENRRVECWSMQDSMPYDIESGRSDACKPRTRARSYRIRSVRPYEARQRSIDEATKEAKPENVRERSEQTSELASCCVAVVPLRIENSSRLGPTGSPLEHVSKLVSADTYRTYIRTLLLHT